MKKYGIIYADPPWAYRNKHCEGGALAHYNTMRLEDICNLPVREIAAQDCVLFLWATYPMLPEALRVRAGDYLALNEWDGEKYTGRALLAKITYMLDPNDIMTCVGGFVILGLNYFTINADNISEVDNDAEQV